MNGYKLVNKNIFYKFCEVFRKMSCSIMTDDDIVEQYNKLDISTRVQISTELKKINTASKIDGGDNQFALSIVEIHMISGKYCVDPAVAFMTGCVDVTKKYMIV